MKQTSKYRWRATLGTAALAVALAMTVRAQAQPGADAATMTLGEVLVVAVRQQPELAQAAIDVEVAEAAAMQAAAVDDWVLDAGVSWSSVRFQVLNQDQDRLSGQAGLTRSLPSGGTVSVRAESGYTSALADTYDHTVSASLTHPLLRGRGRKVARAAQAQARLERDAATLARDGTAIAAVRQVVGAYWELAYAWRALQIRQTSLSLAQERLRNTQAGISAGAVASTEALAVEQTIAGRSEDILLAELDITNRSLTLRRLAGMEIGPGAIELAPSVPLAVSPRPHALDQLLARAYAQSPELAALERRREVAAIEVEVAENGLLPSVDAALSLGPTGVADGSAQALRNMVGFDDVTFTASLSGTYELGQRAAKGAQRRARAELMRRTVTMADVKAEIASALALAVKQAESAARRLELSTRAIELAQKNIEAEKARFELGRATNFDVLERQNELEQAELRRARAMVDYLQAESAIDALTGDILMKYGISLSAAAAAP